VKRALGDEEIVRWGHLIERARHSFGLAARHLDDAVRSLDAEGGGSGPLDLILWKASSELEYAAFVIRILGDWEADSVDRGGGEALGIEGSLRAAMDLAREGAESLGADLRSSYSKAVRAIELVREARKGLGAPGPRPQGRDPRSPFGP